MISIPKFTELLSFSFEACSLTYSFKVSFLIVLLITPSINFISYVLVLALLSILLSIFSLLVLLKYVLIVKALLFSIALTIFLLFCIFLFEVTFWQL